MCIRDSYESDPFTVETFGLYDFRAELVHTIADTNVVLLDATSEVLVHPPCFGLSVLDASGEVLGPLSGASEPLSIELHGGQRVSFRLSPEGTFGAKPTSGVLRVEPPAQANWSFRKDADASLVTEFVELPEGEERISGWAEVEVEVAGSLLPFRLPRFELAYQPAPVRICEWSSA